MQRTTRAARAARLGALGTGAMIVGLCLGFASCGVAPEEDEPPPETLPQGLMSCSGCTKDNCSERCEIDRGGGTKEVSQCTHHIPFCNGPNGFEDPKDPSSPNPTPETGGGPENWCARTNFKSCRPTNDWKLVGQHVKRECGFLGFGCKNVVYDVLASDQTASDCKGCPCAWITRRRCVGRVEGGDWPRGRQPACGVSDPDRAVCN